MIVWLLFLIPLIGGLILLIGPIHRSWFAGASSTTCLATLAAAMIANGSRSASIIEWGGPLRLTATLTPMSALVAMLVPIVAAAVIAYASAHEDSCGLRRLIGLLVLFVAGMELLLIADDFLTVLIGWEAVGACSWALIGHQWRDAEAGESAIYAFIATRLGDLGLFVSAMAVFAGSGSFAFAGLSQLSSGYLALAAAGVTVSAAAKSGQVPFAPWLFRAMAGPTSVSALLHAATMVAAGAYLLLRLQPMLAPVAWFGPVVIGIGLATALTGGLVALVQPHAKKLLAASTSAHYGLMFVATGAGFPLVALFHLVAHALFKSLLFLVAGIAGERAGDYQLRHMGFGALMPMIAGASAIGALALAGVPPLGAGWTKEQIVSAAGSHSALLAILVMLAGMLSAAYAARFHLLSFGIVKDENITSYFPAPVEKAMPALLAIGSIALGALWLGGVHTGLSHQLGGALPDGQLWEIGASLALVVVGLVLGDAAARRRDLGTAGRAAMVADWLGLPRLVDASLVRPILLLSTLAARADDRIVDTGVTCTAWFGQTVSTLVTLADARIVDAGVAWTAWISRQLSCLGSGIGEAMTDGLPTYAARLVATGGQQSVRLQTGMTHHYYVIIVGGIVGVVALLLLGL